MNIPQIRYEKDIYQFQINRTTFYEIILLSCGCCLMQQNTQVIIPYQEFVDIMIKDSVSAMENAND